VAVVADHKSRCDALPVAMLLIGALRHYGWALFEGSTRALVSKASGAAAICCLLLVVWHLQRSRPLGAVLLWWAWEECQVALCSTWFIFDPWPVAPGQAMCSARAGFDLGALGIFVVALLAYRLALSDLRVPKKISESEND
jgi:hypothetical protein